MPVASILFPIIEVEDGVQLNDMTRINCAKSFIGTGASAATSLVIVPEVGVTAIDIFNAGDKTLWYLDWLYTSFTTDIDSFNNKIDFIEDQVTAVATVASGSYTLAQLATAIKTALEAASPGILTYTVSYDSNDKLTISTTGVLSLLPQTGTNRLNQLLKHIGFAIEDKLQQAKSFTGTRTDYVIKKATLTLGDSNTSPATASIDAYLKVFSVNGDVLWSTDAQLAQHEPNILKYVPDGRATFLTQHRLAQTEIIRWLDKQGYVDIFNLPYTKFSIPDINEVTEWSKFLALRMIFEGMVVNIDDIFAKKSLTYKALEVDARNRAILRLDVDGDGKVDIFESIGIGSSVVLRR